jgi:Na+-driven multidrug efflux pump
VLKTLYKITTGLLIALGVVHVLYTAREYDAFSLDALWFISAGIAIILVGLINVILLRGAGKDRVVRWIGFGTNLIVVLLFAAALLVLRAPQVFIGLFLSGFTAAASLLLSRD